MAPRSGQAARPSVATLLSACVVTLAISACGPIEYVSQVTRKASASVAAAKAVDADKYSPYYYTLAVEYLHKARVEAASADFQAANRFGRIADRAAVMAKQEAIDHAGQPIEKYYPNMGENAESGGGMAPLVEPAPPVAPEEETVAPDDEEPASDPGVIEEPDADTGNTDDEEVPPGLGGES